MNESGISGLAAAIIINKKVVWIKGYGYADKESEKPFTPYTLINIASISKTITGACLMRAIEDNKLSLDEDINTYLPFKVSNPFYPKEKITLRNLATHTSGINDQEAYVNSYTMDGDASVSLGEFLDAYFDVKGKYYKKENFLNKKPGTHYEYSNIGAALAGYIIEQVTGVQLNTYSRQKIFEPLKMNSTGWFLSEIDIDNHSKLYYKVRDSIVVLKPYGLVTYPDGGVRTSVADLSKFFICLLNGGELDNIRILSNESVKHMTEPQFNQSSKPTNMKLKKENSGIFWSIEDSGKIVGHDGEDPE